MEISVNPGKTRKFCPKSDFFALKGLKFWGKYTVRVWISPIFCYTVMVRFQKPIFSPHMLSAGKPSAIPPGMVTILLWTSYILFEFWFFVCNASSVNITMLRKVRTPRVGNFFIFNINTLKPVFHWADFPRGMNFSSDTHAQCVFLTSYEMETLRSAEDQK